MATRIGINGFGRMGRLALRAGWGWPGVEFVHINEVAGGAETAAHLLTFDSVHGRWNRHVEAVDGQIHIDGTAVAFSAVPKPGGAGDRLGAPWSGDVVARIPSVVVATLLSEQPTPRRPRATRPLSLAPGN